MPINVFGRSCGNTETKLVTSSFVQKLHLKTKYIESNIEEDIGMKNQFKIKNLPFPFGDEEAASKVYVHNKFNDPSIIRNPADIDFNDKKLEYKTFL